MIVTPKSITDSITLETIAEAAKTNMIFGIKLYPAGVTTNSSSGVRDIDKTVEKYDLIFNAMQTHDLVLNLHGETHGDPQVAEAEFLPILHELERRFPTLRIVLEHVSTKAGVEAVRQCGPNVRGTITAHHLFTTTKDADEDVHSFCKPIPKTLEDRKALLNAVIDGSSKFFFGSDSAPHPIQAKNERAAGCFTQPYCVPLVIDALQHALKQGWIDEGAVKQEVVEGFLSDYGREFYNIKESKGSKQPKASGQATPRIRLEKRGEKIPDLLKGEQGSIEVVPFRRRQEIMSLSWVS